MQSETGFPRSHQLKSYVASKSRLKLAVCAVLSADAGLLVENNNSTCHMWVYSPLCLVVTQWSGLQMSILFSWQSDYTANIPIFMAHQCDTNVACLSIHHSAIVLKLLNQPSCNQYCMTA